MFINELKMKWKILFVAILIFVSCKKLTQEQKERLEYCESHKEVSDFAKSIYLDQFLTIEDSSIKLKKFAVLRMNGQVDKDLFVLIDKKYTTLNPDSIESLVVLETREIIVGKYESGHDATSIETIISFYDLKEKVKFATLNVIGKKPPKKVYNSNYKIGDERTSGILYSIDSKISK